MRSSANVPCKPDKLDGCSKVVLFSGKDGQLWDDLDKIAKVVDRIRKVLKVYLLPQQEE